MTTLYRYRRDGVMLAGAVAETVAVLGEGSAALLYSADWCRFARLEPDGTLSGSDGADLPVDGVFEARVFAQAAELRWLHEAAGQGPAVLLVAEEWRPSGPGWDPAALDYEDTIPQEYLLWGTAMPKPERLQTGWTALAEARVGRLDVPLGDVEAKARVRLRTTEYLRADEHGNLSVAEERLLGLERYHG